jgi:hypothetical protein
MQKFTLYVNEEKIIFASIVGEKTLEKVVIEAETLEQAFKLFNPELYDKKEKEGKK